MKESHYYVNAPGADFPSAEVEAASTKHARTAYLDYLSRNEHIGWRERQAWRRRIVTKRMKYPGEIKTQVYLDYNAIPAISHEYEESPVEGTASAIDAGELAAHQREINESIELEEETGVPAADHFVDNQVRKEQGMPTVLPSRNPWGNSPVMDLSKKSRGA